MVDTVTIFITFFVIIFGYWLVRKRSPKFPPGIIVFGSTIFEMPRGVPSGGSKRGAPPPLRPKIFSISCSFLENLTYSYVGAPRRVGAPSYRESWIRPWYRGKRPPGGSACGYRRFHKCTKLAKMTLVPTLYPHKFAFSVG